MYYMYLYCESDIPNTKLRVPNHSTCDTQFRCPFLMAALPSA